MINFWFSGPIRVSEFLVLCLIRVLHLGPLVAPQESHVPDLKGEGGGQKDPSALFRICHTYPTVMKLVTVIPYLKKIQKLYKSRDTPL